MMVNSSTIIPRIPGRDTWDVAVVGFHKRGWGIEWMPWRACKVGWPRGEAAPRSRDGVGSESLLDLCDCKRMPWGACRVGGEGSVLNSRAGMGSEAMLDLCDCKSWYSGVRSTDTGWQSSHSAFSMYQRPWIIYQRMVATGVEVLASAKRRL